MKNLVLTACVLGAASLATACTSLGTVSVTWSLQDWDATNSKVITGACPAGADTAIVYALPLGDTNTANADKDLFNCAAGAGTTAGHISGTYTFWVEITDHSGNTIYSQSTSQQASVSDGTNQHLVFPANAQDTFQVSRGFITAAWSLKGAASGNAVTCTQANSYATTAGGVAPAGVENDAMVGTALPISDQFDCPPMAGTTYPLPPANYADTLQVIDHSATPKALGAGSVVNNVNVRWGNDLASTGTVVLTVDTL